ncbi:MAG: peptidoglycan DD-metalloendopeptidase family protein [Clostridia bacterium]|nr:peptidoglycan DD-metalloendopeptidase family protein [Clostridia bacterium]
MMRELFLTIAEITLAMTPILLIALLFCRFARRWSAGCRYAIWCVLLLRLAIPLNFSLPFLTIDLAPSSPEPMPQFYSVLSAPVDYVVPPVSVDYEPYVTYIIPDTAYIENTATLPTVEISTIAPAEALCWMWAIGAAAVLLHQAVRCLSASAKLRRWKRPVHDARLLGALERAKSALGIKRQISLWLCAEVSSPMLRGLIRPEILLPHSNYTDEQLDAILRHELIHCRRGDLWWKLCGMLATALHFFNPLVWIAQKQQEIEMEQSCDDAVFRLGNVSRHAYGETMLAVAREGISAPTAGLNTQFHASAKHLRARFANILDSSAKRAGVWLIALTLVVAAICGGLVSCREEASATHDASDAIEAAMAAADDAWDFTSAYVSFDGDTATVSALYNAGGHANSETAVQTGWADITMHFSGDKWRVSEGLDGALNWRSTAAEDGRRSARELKRTAEVEALIRTVWPDENGLDLAEAANRRYQTAQAYLAELQNSGSSLGEMQNTLDDLLAEQAAPDGSSVESERRIASLKAEIDGRRKAIAAMQSAIEQQAKDLHAVMPSALRDVAYPLTWIAPTIDLTVPAQNAEPALEMACPAGMPVLAVADGVVLAAGYDAVDGNFVLIDHGEGGFTRYCWLSSVSVAEGDTVKHSHQIGLTGRSGHARMAGLRFVVSLGSSAVDPKMLYYAVDGILSVPGETSPGNSVAGFSVTAPVAGEPTFAFLSPNVGSLADGTIFMESSAEYFAPADTPVYAAAPGTVTLANEDPALGCYVQIDHGNGFETRYVFLRSLAVKVGQTVDRTTQIGTIAPADDGREPRVGMTICRNGYTIDNLKEYIFSAGKRDPLTGTPETTPPTTIAPPADTTAPTPAFFSLVSPLLEGTYTIGTPFGWHDNYGTQFFQKGATYPAETGTPVFAAASGTVTAATYDWELGNYVRIEHWDGYITTYAHLSKITYGIEPGVQIGQGTMIGQVGSTGDSTGPHLGFMLQKDGDYTDPEPHFFNSTLRAVYTYTLSSGLPKLHSWTQMTDLHLSTDTVSRLGSEYTAIDYVLSQLYGKDHKFGQYTLRPEQITINGKTMDSVWEIQYSSYESILIAMQAGGGEMYLAQAVAPYRANAAVWHRIINGNTGSTLDKTDYTASTVKNPSPLFTAQVWFVKNEKYEVKLTGVATAKLEVPVVYEAVADPDLPAFTADMPLDGLMTRANKARIAAEYETALDYLTRKYGERHGYTSLTLTTSMLEGYDSVWFAQTATGGGIHIAMKAGGSFYIVGYLDTGLFSPAIFDTNQPTAQMRPARSSVAPLLPCEITFTLPQIIDFAAENPVRYYAEDERFGPYDGWRYFGTKGEIQTVSVPARSTYTSQMYSSYVRNDIGRILGGGRLPDSPDEVAQMMVTLGTPFWQSMGRTPTAVTLKETQKMTVSGLSLCRAIYTLVESENTVDDFWIVYFLCEGDTVSAFAVRPNEMFDHVLSMADHIVSTYRPAGTIQAEK